MQHAVNPGLLFIMLPFCNYKTQCTTCTCACSFAFVYLQTFHTLTLLSHAGMRYPGSGSAHVVATLCTCYSWPLFRVLESVLVSVDS